MITHAYAVDAAFRDSASLDAFSRVRVSQPFGLFDCQFTYNLKPLIFEPITNGSGAAVTHGTTNRCALMTFDNTPTGGKAFLQSFEYVHYQPGRSQAAFITFNMVETKANTLKFAGLCDGTNGIQFELNGTTKQFSVYSGTTNGTETAAQASWNLDMLDGFGPSGLTLDVTESQILVIDFQALYVGRVRVGFDLGGTIVYCHQFVHANTVAYPYFQYASLPVRVGMTSTGTVSTTMNFICSAVLAEGGQNDTGGTPFSTEGTVTAGSGTDTHILSVRPKTTFNSIANHTKVILDHVVLTVNGTFPVIYKVCIGQSLTSPTYSDVNSTYSSCEKIAGTATLSGTPAIIVAQGYVATTDASKSSPIMSIEQTIPLTLDAAGAVRANGTVTILVQATGGTSATRATLHWRELR